MKNIYSLSAVKTFVVVAFLFLIPSCMFYSNNNKPLKKTGHGADAKFSAVEIKELIAKILANGGYVSTDTGTFETKRCVNPVTGESSESSIEDIDIEKIDSFCLRDMAISGTEVKSLLSLKPSDIFIENLTLNNIDEIFVHNTPIATLFFQNCKLDHQFGVLVNSFDSIDHICFKNSEFKRGFFDKIDGSKIQKMSFSNTTFSRDFLSKALTFDNLKYLGFTNVDMDDDDLDFLLNKCPVIRYIQILCVDIKCNFIQNMKKTDSIVAIAIEETRMDDSLLRAIERFDNLKDITVANCMVTANSKDFLTSISNKFYCIKVISGEQSIFYVLNKDNYVPILE